MKLNKHTATRIRAMIDGGVLVVLEDVLGAADRAEDIVMSEDEFLREIEARARRRIAADSAAKRERRPDSWVLLGTDNGH